MTDHDDFFSYSTPDEMAADWLTEGSVTPPFGRIERRSTPPLAGYWLISDAGAHGPFKSAEHARDWARRQQRHSRPQRRA